MSTFLVMLGLGANVDEVRVRAARDDYLCWNAFSSQHDVMLRRECVPTQVIIACSAYSHLIDICAEAEHHQERAHVPPRRFQGCSALKGQRAWSEHSFKIEKVPSM